MSAGAVRAGGVFVEIGADPKKFFAALNSVNKSLANMGKGLVSGGGRLAAIGAGFSAPIAAAVSQGAKFESTLLAMRASAGMTGEQIDQIKSASMDMSKALGVGPTAATQGMLELLKAGMDLETVLGGAGKSALEFAKVGELEVAQAAVVMNDALNVFGVSGEKAANTLSAAADASSTSIQEMAQAFSQSSAVAGLANQNIDDLSAALAILANNGVKGSDAGTSVKTMLTKLMAPSNEAASALESVGLSLRSFVNPDTGKMLPMVDIIQTLNGALGKMDETARKQILSKIFGADAIRAAAILTSTGVDGFNEMRKSMASAMPVSEKFKTIMSGLYGAGQQVLSALERLSIAIADAVAPALAAVVPFVTGLIDGLTNLARANPATVAGFAKLAVAAVGVGGALTGLGVSFQVASFGFAGIGKAATLALSPLTLVASAAGGVGKSFALAMPETIKLVKAVGASLVGAATSAIAYGSSLATMAAATAARLGFVAATWTATGIAISAGFLAHIKAMVTYYTGALAGVQAITISRAGATAAAWISSAVGADTFANAMKAAMTTSNRVVSSTVAAITPAISFLSKGLSAVASDVGRLVAPLTRPFVAVGQSVAMFAGEISNGLAFTYKQFTWWASGVAMFAGEISNGLAFTYKQFTWWASGVAMQGKAYVMNVARIPIATATAAASIVGSWIATAMPATAAFAAGAARSIGTYIASTVAAAAASVANAARSGLAWIAAGLPGLTAFAAGAVRAIGVYLGAAASAVAGSVASAAAVAAAWLAPLAPVALIVAAVAGAGVAIYAFRDKLSGAFSGIGGYIKKAAGAISGTFGSAIEDAKVVVSDLYSTAKKTFSGIYDAIAAGDLAGAMEIAMAGVQAAFYDVAGPLLIKASEWATKFQSIFDDIGVGIAVAMESASGFFEKNVGELGNPQAWGAAPAVAGVKPATREELAKRADAIQARTDRNVGAMESDAKDRASGRLLAAQEFAASMQSRKAGAKNNLGDLVRGKAEVRAIKSQVDDLLTAIRGATSIDQLAGVGGLGDQFQTLGSMGLLNSAQETALSDALDKAAESLTRVATASGTPGTVDPAANVGTPDTRLKSESLGTFSSLNLGQMFGGTSIAEQTLRATQEVAKNTRKIGDGDKVAA